MLAVFDFIVPRLPLNSIKEDLTISLKSKGSGIVVQLSLLDYLQCLGSRDKPSAGLMSLHHYVCKYVTLPRMLVQNRFLLDK